MTSSRLSAHRVDIRIVCRVHMLQILCLRYTFR